ncbi:MAG: hypothetical protein DMF64_16500 [Acidobacteria bacterium]|nr:MAG: hypothetical protein DMF64_16500 [Acidobacteriota bacterium]
MIAKSYILRDLTTIGFLYRQSTSIKRGLFYSKLAILELCGWIEESMDDIILTCANRHLKNPANLKLVEKSIIGRTYGFEYEKHFRNMLIQLIGTINLERIEYNFDPVKFQVLKAQLNALKAIRDTEAHTHLKGITKRLDAPSVTKGRFPDIYNGLTDIDTNIRNFRF